VNVHVQPGSGPGPGAARPQRETRKAPRFKIPARLVVDDRSFEVLDWSSSGIGFSAPGATLEIGAPVQVQLAFDLPGGTVSTELDAEIRHFDRRTGRGGLSYETADGAMPAVPAFVIDEYLSGRIAAMDGILTKGEVLRAAVPVDQQARQGDGVLARFRRVLGLGLITIAGAAALYFLFASAYDRLFVFEAASAQISFPSFEQDSPVAGTLTMLAEPGPILAGAPLFQITDSTGLATAVTSPCSCEIAKPTRVVGEYVAAGAVITKLIDGSSAPSVLVAVAFPDIGRVYEGAAVDLRFLSGPSVRSAKITSIQSLAGRQTGIVTVEVDPGVPLNAAQFGEPVYARFDTAPWRRN
jgi:hypothetical protein